MVKRLQISSEVAVPVDVVTERLAVVGQSGSGKTYAAMRLAELILDAGAQVIALDPMGVWWGLLSSAGGKSSGFPVHVFGGEYAHVPIVPEAGALVADVLVQRQISAVIDLSHFTRSEQVQFALAFAERFFKLQVKAKQPVHVFFEEAQTFMPQNLPPEGRGGDPRKNPAVMLNRMELLVRQGRSQGVGCTMITQAPQAVAKSCLNQAGTLFAMRTMGAHERKAIAAWMADKATDTEQLDVDALLPKLKTGEAYLASPELLQVFRKVKITEKVTFDSSATPKFGAVASTPKVLADVDVAALRDAMKEVVDQVEADDVDALKRRIVLLERQAKQRTAGVVEQKIVQVPVVSAKDRQAMERLTRQAEALGTQLSSLHDRFAPLRISVEDLKARLKQVLTAKVDEPRRLVVPPAQVPAPIARAAVAHVAKVNGATGAQHAAGDVAGLSKRALDMLRELVAAFPKGLTRKQLATRSLLRVNRNFRLYQAELRNAGLLTDDDNGDLIATDAARKLIGVVQPKTLGDLVAQWNGLLSNKASVMLSAVLGKPEGLTRAELAHAAGLQGVNRNFRLYQAELRNACLIEPVAGGRFVAGGALFLGEA